MTREEFNEFIRDDIFGMCHSCKNSVVVDRFNDKCKKGLQGEYECEPCPSFEVSDKIWRRYSKSTEERD